MGDEKLAEFIGILLGDGNLGIYKSRADGKVKTQYRIKITLDSLTDREYCLHVVRLIEGIFGKKPVVWKRKDARAVDLFIFGENYLQSLLRLGMALAPKWDRATIPMAFTKHRYGRLVVRGYMDTDGCICVVNNNGIRYPRIEMKICPSPMQEQFIGILIQNGFKPQISKLEKGKVRVTLAGIGNLKRWNELIGFSNERNQKVANSFLGETTTQHYKAHGR
ncbi:MAG: hypothetical protein AB1324_01875 [Candidatus Micrarchaeota archaeon]